MVGEGRVLLTVQPRNAIISKNNNYINQIA